jgi:hypothetical protein
VDKAKGWPYEALARVSDLFSDLEQDNSPRALFVPWLHLGEKEESVQYR